MNEQNDPYEGYASFSSKGISDELRVEYLSDIFSNDPKKEISPKEEAKVYYRDYERDTGIPFSEYVDSRVLNFFRERYKQARDEVFIYSFSMAAEQRDFPYPLTNLLMWAHYAGGFRGYCIEFDFEELVPSIERLNNIEIGRAPIKYATDGKLPVIQLKSYMDDTLSGNDVSAIDTVKTFFIKEQSWKYENEYRFITKKGNKIAISQESIKSIYLSENIDEPKKSKIISIVKDKESPIQIFQVKLHHKNYEFGFECIHEA
jgi:hypothetical protein